MPGFAIITTSLYSLTRKEVQYVWGVDCQQAFMALKQALLQALVLLYPDPELPYILDTDASQEIMEAILLQL